MRRGVGHRKGYGKVWAGEAREGLVRRIAACNIMYFGADAKILAACSNPSEIDNEQALVAQLQLKTGPHADHARLLHHVRGARGKLHWAGEPRAAWLHGCMDVAAWEIESLLERSQWPRRGLPHPPACWHHKYFPAQPVPCLVPPLVQ